LNESVSSVHHYSDLIGLIIISAEPQTLLTFVSSASGQKS